MANLYKTNPSNPVDYLGKWLFNYSQVKRAAEDVEHKNKEVEKHKKEHQKELDEEAKVKAEAERKERLREKKINTFKKNVESS